MKPLAQNSLIQNRYLIVQLIGKGGMGEVYLAVDQRLGSAVALKRTYFAGDEMLGNAFEREARTLARMRHPVLPKVSDHFGEGEEQYLVMEHISGDDLSNRLESAQKPFPISWVLFWADQLLDALSYLHSHEPPIIHRDIKPQNLKLTDENNIVLLDFGLSKTSTGMTNISQSGSTGSVVGYTPHYAPMEQIRGIGTSARSDLYSLSATLYQLLTNAVPPDALSRADVMLNGSPDPIKPLHELNPEVSKTVSDVILKGMEVSQEKRFGDAREMQRVLRRAFTDMQEAMSANTVAFSGQIEAVGAGTLEKPQIAQSEISSPRTVVEQTAAAMPQGSPNDVDFDATIAYDPHEPQAKQSDIRTEVFLAGDGAFQIPAAENYTVPGESVETENVPAEVHADVPDDFSLPSHIAEIGSVAEATVPLIAFDSTPHRVEAPPTPEKRTPVAAPPKKSSGKAAAMLGGLAALFILAVLAAGGGWYVYSNYYAGVAEAEPTPTPSATIEATPSPEPTLEAVVVTNANTEVSNSGNVNSRTAGDANRANDVTVAPTPIAVQTPQQTDVTTRPSAPAPAQPRTPNRPAATPGTKATPKPKTSSDRTVILQ